MSQHRSMKARSLAVALLAACVTVSASASYQPLATRASAAQAAASPASITLDNVTLDIQGVQLPPETFAVSAPGSATQMASWAAWAPFREFSISAVPYGTKPGNEDLPAAASGKVGAYRLALREFRVKQGGRVQDGPTVMLFGHAVTGMRSRLRLPIDAGQPQPVILDEWVVQAGARFWIVRATQQQASDQISAPPDFASGLQLQSSTLDAPSTLGQQQPLQAAPLAGSSSSADLPAPSWWSGDCDTNTYSSKAGYPAYRLGANYLGMPACGPRPWADKAKDVLVRFYAGAWGVYEWECVELSMRFMYLKYSIAPYGGNGSQVVQNYPGTRLVKIGNGTVGSAPQPNDILSYGATTTFGHTSVVTSSNVDINGNGSITIIEENASASGSSTLSVSNWRVSAFSTVSGWLHDPGTDNLKVVVNGGDVGSYTMLSGESLRQSYTNVDAGPVRVYHTDGLTPIVASQRINLKLNTGYVSYSEFMGVPGSKLSDVYLFPWYNNATFGGLASELDFANVGSGPTTVTVTIGQAVWEKYSLAANTEMRVTYPDVDTGPVQVQSSGGVPIVVSERIYLKAGKGFDSYTELLGLSASSSAATRYIFPWYNNATFGGLDSQLRFGNVGAQSTNVTVKIGGTPRGSYTLRAGESQRISYLDLDAGPVEITSSDNVPIIASQRINLKSGKGFDSYTELMGLPGITLNETRYVFPIYTNTTASGLEGQLRFGNAGSSSTTVYIKIGGVVQPTSYDLGPSESQRITFADVDTGPVEVYTTDGVPIIASMRVNMQPSLDYASNAEFMGLSVGAGIGLPTNQLSSSYWFPWYNNATWGGLDSQLRFALP